MDYNKISDPEKAAGYKQLTDRFGAREVADRLLAKWLSDDDAMETWERLFADVKLRFEPEYEAWLKRPPRPYKYWVILWYLSMGFREQDVAEQLGISVWTVQREITYVRKNLNMLGSSLSHVVATAIRLGKIP